MRSRSHGLRGHRGVPSVANDMQGRALLVDANASYASIRPPADRWLRRKAAVSTCAPARRPEQASVAPKRRRSLVAQCDSPGTRHSEGLRWRCDVQPGPANSRRTPLRVGSSRNGRRRRFTRRSARHRVRRLKPERPPGRSRSRRSGASGLDPGCLLRSPPRQRTPRSARTVGRGTSKHGRRSA